MKKVLGLKVEAPRKVGERSYPSVIGWALVDQKEDVETPLNESEIMNRSRQLIGRMLETVMAEKGMTLKKVAVTAKLSEQEVTAIMSGKQYPFDHFLKVIRGLDCYFYLANKDGNENDMEDLKEKGKIGR